MHTDNFIFRTIGSCRGQLNDIALYVVHSPDSSVIWKGCH